MAINKTIIQESAKETAKKVRKSLKAKFPETKFSVTAENSGYTTAVNVEYVSGAEPERVDVNMFLRRFKPARYNAASGINEICGYEYDGNLYHGADHIHYTA